MAMSVDAKLLKQTKFPIEFNQKVDMKKVNVEVMKKYVSIAARPDHNPNQRLSQMDCRQNLRDSWKRG